VSNRARRASSSRTTGSSRRLHLGVEDYTFSTGNTSIESLSRAHRATLTVHPLPLPLMDVTLTVKMENLLQI
jgi:hypothetical protein